jgi:predicted pyridoxine 5'-phosphate oxidase superfamily flavin-nucleotide-binding protein
MTTFYGEHHRALQDQFESRRMADRMEETIVKTALDDLDKHFVSTRDMFFLATVDHNGRPTVSYKGGDAGFIKIVDDRTIAFPSYDGNGMYFSMGNLAGNPEIGILFIDFEVPNRMRLQGRASITPNDPLLAEYKEADLVVRIAITQTWVNCPRYIHRFKKLAPSRYVPRAGEQTPFCVWKRIDGYTDVLRPHDMGRTEAEGGLLSIEQYMDKVAKGEG